MNPTMNPIVIIGSGLAGYGLARELRKRDRDVPITVITADDGRAYAKPNLSNALAAGKGPEQLASQTPEQVAAAQNLRVLAHTRVTAIDRAAKTVATDRGAIPYAKLVLALGADPMPHGLEGEVYSVNDLGDYARFRAALDGTSGVATSRVAILGGGLIGCEFANDLAGAGHAVSVVHRGPWPLERLIPEDMGRELAAALAAQGVAWHLGRSAQALEPIPGGQRLTLDDGSQVEADLVLAAIGLRPRIALAAAAGLTVNRGIVVDRQLASSDPDIHGVGDCAEVAGLVLPFVLPLMQQIKALAASLTGQPTPVAYPAMPVVVKTPAYPLAVLPPAPGTAGEWHVEPPGERQDGGLRALFQNGDGELAGFALSGDRTGERQALAGRMPAQLG